MAHPLQIDQSARRESDFEWNPDQLLAETLAERDQFLEKYPQYRSLQDEIDQLLDKAGSPENRMSVLALLMEAKLIEMQDQFRQLGRLLIAAAS